MKKNDDTTKVSTLDFANRLKKAIKYIKFNTEYSKQAQIAEKINFGRTNLSAAINGEEKYLTEGLARKITDTFTNISFDWLFAGTGEMLIASKPNLPNTVTPVPEEDYMMVEYVDLATNAGTLGGGIIADLDDTRKRLVPREYDKGLYLVVRVSGDSMNDGTNRSLKDGDEILVRLWQENIQYLPMKRKLFVINTADGSVVKQVTNIDYEEKFVTLHSFNPSYEDYDVYFDDIVQIFTVEKIVNSKIEF